ncbi:MAG TPA: AAA family ATPase [Candidatus Nanopelagicales bacterium]|jgi:exonuclease SbcC
MRLHHLSLDAFGPYATAQDVDFDLLSASGLFLLEGPTGAGKSTVLDAVTFALYGELSAETSARDRLHSDFAAPGRTPTVTLEWSVRGRRLRVTRIPEHERPSKRKGGAPVKEASSVHLEQLEDGGWVSLSSNKAETGQLVTDLMGLNRAQFTQVVLLPQGEFARFLRADDDTRRELLTKLFGTHLYDRVTVELENRRYDAQRARGEAQHHVEQALAAAGQAAGLDAEARQALVALDPTDLSVALDDIGQRLAGADQDAQVAAELARGRLTTVTAAREDARSFAERVRRVVEAQEQVAAHERTRAAHLQRAEELAAMRRAEPVRPLLAALAECEDTFREAYDRLAELVADPTEPMRRGEGALAATEAATQATTTLAGLAHLAELEGELPARRTDHLLARQDADAAQLRVAEHAAALAELPGRVAELEAELAAFEAAVTPLQSAQDRLPHARDRLAAAQQAADLDPKVVSAHAEWMALSAARVSLVREHEGVVTRRLAGISAEMASALVPGTPCGVCGSTEHPLPATASGVVVTAEELDRVAGLRDQAEQECQESEERLRALTSRRDTLSGVIDGGDLVELRAEVERLDQVVLTATDAATHAVSTRGELAGFRERSATLQEQLTSATSQDATARTRVAAVSAALASDEAKIEAGLDGHASIAARCAALQRAALYQGRLAARLSAVASGEAARREAAARAEAEALAQGFGGLAEALGAAADEATRSALAEQVSTWELAEATLRAALAAPDLAGVEEAHAPVALEQLQTAQAALAQAEAEHKLASDSYATATRTAQAWSQCMADVRRANAAQARTQQETAAVIRLAALAKGTDGQRRVALTTYVLRHWFHQVVQVANLRLSAMSAGRYELERIDEAETKAKRAGLTLTVIDRHTGERRHPASLSGGETFFTSLALALGLADVVKAEAGGVDLDTLFIDEGFGSLDASTLDQVMTVIDELRDRGRVIGIVSHVAELKDRVPERLEIRRIQDGSSVVQVVA